MAKITKLGQTFVAKQEATAASQNAQNAKIDEIIDAFTTSDGTVALPLTKSGVAYEVTTLGTGLSVSGNTLNGTTYTLPAATQSSLGGVKVGDGLSIGASGSTAGVLKVEHDSTLKITDGVLSVTNPGGGVTMAQVESAITSALSGYATTSSLSSYVKKTDATLSTVGGNGKYVQSVSQSNGKVNATAVDMPSLISNDLMYFTKASANDYQIAGATVQTTSFTNNVANVNISNSHKTLVLLLPTDKDSFTLRDSGSQDITGDLIFVSTIVRGGKLYNMFYFSGTTVADNYTLTKNS